MESQFDNLKKLICKFELGKACKVTKTHNNINSTVVGSLCLLYSIGTILINNDENDSRNIVDKQAEINEEDSFETKQEKQSISETLRKVKEEEKIENSNNESSLESSSDSTENTPLTECIIREIKGPISEIGYVIENEIVFLANIKSYNFVAVPYGCSISKEEGNAIIYSTVYPKPKWTLESYFLQENSVGRLKILRQLLKIVEHLNSKSIFYGNFSPKSVFLDDELNVSLEPSFFSKKFPVTEKMLIEHSLILKLANQEYLSPEARLGVKTAELYGRVITYNLMLSDIFSIGLVMLKATCGKNMENESLELNEKEIKNLFQKAASIVDCQFFYPNCGNNYRNELKNCGLNKSNHKILFKMLTVNPEKRLKIKHLNYAIKEIEQEINILNESEKNQEALIPQAFRLSPFIEHFIKLVEYLENKELPFDIFGEWLFSLLSTMHNNDHQELEKIQNCYLEKTIGSEIDLDEGLSTFFLNFYNAFVLDKNRFHIFINSIRRNRSTNMDYSGFFIRLLTIKSEIHKDYAVNLLLVMPKYYNNFYKFFNMNSIIFSEMHITSILQFPNLVLKMRNIIEWSPIVDYFCRTLNISDIDEFFNEVIQITFLAKMYDRLYGFVTFNKRIFLSDFEIDINSDCSMAQNAALFITFLHEMAHYSRRRQAVLRKECSIKLTPKSKDSDKATSYYREGGYQFEKYLFDAVPIDVNNDAGEYFLNVKNETREEFAITFKEKNISGPESINLSRENFSTVSLGICGFNNLKLRKPVKVYK